uniref:BPTI/Kunitz inhibitor domain-containing protein n=1 Tax=Parascaris equorum TaxID=6256 RepID=A0A914RS21_PAREQ
MVTTRNSASKIRCSNATEALMQPARLLVRWPTTASVIATTAPSITRSVSAVHHEFTASAFACIQPPSEGYTPPGGGATLNHWYHDPITGECRELKYQGYGGNANNFQTKDHCESYCKQTCNRGLPLYRDRTTGVKQEPVYCQGSDGGCNNPNYVCTTMGTLQQCCPTYRKQVSLMWHEGCPS